MNLQEKVAVLQIASGKTFSALVIEFVSQLALVIPKNIPLPMLATDSDADPLFLDLFWGKDLIVTVNDAYIIVSDFTVATSKSFQNVQEAIQFIVLCSIFSKK